MAPSDGDSRAALPTLTALLLAALLTGLACCMLFPVRWNGPGWLGASALHFPLHLLAFTLVAGLLGFVARARGARLAAWWFRYAAILAAVMALTPSLALWQRAWKWNVPLSLGDYLASAGHVNEGRPQPDRSVLYGTASDGTKLELDVWRSGRPDTEGRRPAIVMAHGGAWNHGNRSMLPDWDRWLNGLGYEVFDVEYRMPPPVRWRDEVGDVKSALGWVAAHAAEYHVDPARISLMGASAGANLALLAAYSRGDTLLPPSTAVPPVRVRCVINFYGPTDMGLMYRACPSPGYVRPLMRDYIGGGPERLAARYLALSPIRHVTPDAPPTLTISGTSDRLVSPEHAEALDRALTAAGVAHETVLLPGVDHGFDVNWGGFGTQIARTTIRRFLARHDGR